MADEYNPDIVSVVDGTAKNIFLKSLTESKQMMRVTLPFSPSMTTLRISLRMTAK